jgi:hypothetical protein
MPLVTIFFKLLWEMKKLLISKCIPRTLVACESLLSISGPSLKQETKPPPSPSGFVRMFPDPPASKTSVDCSTLVIHKYSEEEGPEFKGN